jgi:L-ribulokinase
MIIETFEASGVPVHEIVATGGLPDRNKLLMQIYADVSGRPIKVGASGQGPALGSAMHGAVAAGKAAGGYDSIVEAAQHMARLRDESTRPTPKPRPSTTSSTANTSPCTTTSAAAPTTP